MKKIILPLLLTFLIFKTSLAQKKDVRVTIKEATEAFDVQDYETAIKKIDEIKFEFKKNNPPPFILSLEILSKAEIIKGDPFANYALINSTRNLVTKYLQNSITKIDPKRALVVRESYILNSYPQDLVSFNVQKEIKLKEERLQKERAEKAAIEQKIKLLRETVVRDSLVKVNAIKAKLQFTKDSLLAITQAKIDADERKKAAIKQAEKDREQKIIDRKNARSYNFRNNTFSNIGVIGGEIAKYGLLFEHGGGNNFLGYYIAIRSSLTKEDDVISGKEIENKTEFNVGPNFKISNYVYLNLGAGYGFYNYPNRNDYTDQTPTIEKQTYLVTSGGLMFRLGRLINISAGVSFMDIDKGFYTPEITGGLTFNLK